MNGRFGLWRDYISLRRSRIPGAKNTSIRTSVRFVGVADKPCAQGGLHSVVSVITAGNTASERLHEKFGFRFCGTLHEVGMKMGEYRDIDNFELLIGQE